MYRLVTAERFPDKVLVLVLSTLIIFLAGFQVPMPDGVGSGTVTVQVQSATGEPVVGIRVEFRDEWERALYATCTTDLQGTCTLRVAEAPALGVLVRGVVTAGSGYQDAMFLKGEHITVRLQLDEMGAVDTDADVLATRDPNTTPTLVSVEDALATLTVAAQEPLATPSPGIVLTIAAAYDHMTATAVARRSPTPTPRLSSTPTSTAQIGVAVVVDNTPAPVATRVSTTAATAPDAAMVEASQVWVRIAATGIVLLVIGVALWRSRRRTTGRAGGGA